MTPDGYVEHEERGALIVALPFAAEAVRAAILEHGSLYSAAAVAPGAQSFAGRGAAYRMPIAGGDVLVRHYHRGGAIARFLADRYLDVGERRPLRELRASAAARARGVATPQVVAAVVYPAGAFYRADLATRFIDRSADLAEVSFGAATAGSREAGWRAAGRLLKTAFDAGVEHVDLNLRNILITQNREITQDRKITRDREAYLLDLDRAEVGSGAVDDAVRRRMLERLHRSRRKLESRHGLRVGAAELAAFEAEL